MTELVRWRPMWTTRMSLLNEFDRLIDDFFALSERQMEMPATWSLAVDMAETDDAYVVKASVPGIDPDDIEVTLTNGVLSIKGESREEKEFDEESYHLRERRYGHFLRSISLPTQVNADAIEATYDQGVLTLTIPKAEEVKPKRIAVKTSAKKVIEGKSS